jgi:hypothetical protein
MTRKYIPPLAILLMILITGCGKEGEGECGAQKTESVPVYAAKFFSQPSEIYWGVTGNIRSYTYNWTLADNCTKQNPKVSISAVVIPDNKSLSNPFSFDAGTQTCFGVQPRSAILIPNASQHLYVSAESEIGMQQCFGGQSSATIYPFVTVSFTSLGSSNADSLYLVQHLEFVSAYRIYNTPK